MTPTWVFLFCGFYGVALCALILSWHVTPVLIKLFVSDEYTLGTHGQIWANWHAIGCLFLGVVNLQVYFGTFNPEAMRSIAWATTMIYGTWAVQNLFLMLNNSKAVRFKPYMWLNVTLCALASVASVWAALSIA